MLEWLTLCPTWTPLPVTEHFRAIPHLDRTPPDQTPARGRYSDGRAHLAFTPFRSFPSTCEVPPLLADRHLDASIPRFGNAMGRRHKGVAGPVISNLDDLAWNPRRDERAAYGCGASQGERQIVGIGTRRVGMTDDADVGVFRALCRGACGFEIAARSRVELRGPGLEVEGVNERRSRCRCERAGELTADVGLRCGKNVAQRCFRSRVDRGERSVEVSGAGTLMHNNFADRTA